jgi:hypothetical protein
MYENEDANNETETVKIVIVLKKGVYELVAGISTKLGMDPSSWIGNVVESKLKREVP